MTREDKVLQELKEALKGKEYIAHGMKIIGGWVPNHHLLDVDVGAVAGLRALRRLKPLGYRYEKKQFIDPATNKPTQIWLYRLTSPYPDLSLAKNPDRAMKRSYVKEDIYASIREQMNNCALCGRDGMPKGMIATERGVQLCTCHPKYKKIT